MPILPPTPKSTIQGLVVWFHWSSACLAWTKPPGLITALRSFRLMTSRSSSAMEQVQGQSEIHETVSKELFSWEPLSSQNCPEVSHVFSLTPTLSWRWCLPDCLHTSNSIFPILTFYWSSDSFFLWNYGREIGDDSLWFLHHIDTSLLGPPWASLYTCSKTFLCCLFSPLNYSCLDLYI